MPVSRRNALKISACLLRVSGYLEHFLPVKFVACCRHFVVLVARMRDSLCDICGMGSDLAGNYALLDVVEVGESEVLRRSHIAQEVRAACSSNSAADRGGDVVVSLLNYLKSVG